jgi:ornithine--oxo-acid transaminase
LNLSELLEARSAEKFDLFEKYLNAQLVKMLRTVRFDVDYVRGEGAYLFDRDGDRYLDLLSGFGVFACGRNHPAIVKALEQVLHSFSAGLVQLDVSLLAGLLAERLCSHVPWLDKAYFCNSGAEAVEAAIKFSRAATGRSRILYCSHAYHGLTYGALSLTADPLYRKGFEPLVGDCVEIPFNDIVSLQRELARGDVAAFIVEPIQGKGVNMPLPGYLVEAAALCKRHGTIFVADEIQTGLGRTGRFLACDHFGVQPDIVLLAKSLSGGFIPVGAVLTREWIFNRVFSRMDRAVVHGSTFSKNDMAMAAGLATLDVMAEEGLVERASILGEQLMIGLRSRLANSEFIAEIRGLGMMIGIELRSPRSLKLQMAYRMIEQARRGLFCQLLLIPLLREHRILAQVAGSELPVIKLLPSFVISEADVDWIVSAFGSLIEDVQHLGHIWEHAKTLVDGARQARSQRSA